MKLGFKRVLAALLCLLLFCGVLPVSAEQTVTTVTRHTVPSYFGPASPDRVLPGDINGDTYADNRDITVLFRHLTGWDVAVNEAALDTNNDGLVNNKDLTRLFQYLSGWDVKVYPLCEHYGGTATCHEKAICEFCGRHYGELDAGNHSGGTEVRDAVPASCLGNGYEGTTYCLGCGVALSYGNIIPTNGEHLHTEIRNAYPATCANSGYTGDTYCTDCGEKLSEGDYIPPTGIHLHTEYRNGYAPTCSESGYTGDVYCIDCGLLLYGGDYIEPTGEHITGDWSSDAYIHWKNCTVCGIMLNQAQHSGGKATCTKKAVCTVCGAEYGAFDDTNHNYSDEVVAPTCFDVGYTRHTCLDCGYSYVSDYVPVLSHTGGKATCHSGAICELCGTEYGGWDYSNHDGGTRIEGATEATETEDGYTGNVICNGCNEVLSYGRYYHAQFYAYNLLNANQKSIYNILDTAVQNLDESYIYLDNYATDAVTGESDINVAFRALSYDKPDYFWIPRSYGVGKTVNSNTGKLIHIFVSFEGMYHVSASQKASMQAALEVKVNEIVAAASAYDTDFDREVYIHDYICKHTEYNYDAAGSSSPDYRAFTAYGAFVLGTCVCEGYSRAMQLICQRLNIPCHIATGVYYSQDSQTGTWFSTPHMWNIINPGDGRYYLDVTFDDLDYDDPELFFPLFHGFFNLSHEETALDHVFDDMYVPGTDYSDVGVEYNFFDSQGNNYNLGYYTNTHAYILKNNATACADYLVAAKARGQKHADIFFENSALTPENAILLLNNALAGRMRITKYFPAGEEPYINVMIP